MAGYCPGISDPPSEAQDTPITEADDSDAAAAAAAAREAIRLGKQPASTSQSDGMIAAMQAKLDALEQSFRYRMSILYSRTSALLEPLKPFSGKANSQSWMDFEAAFVTRMHAAHVPRSE